MTNQPLLLGVVLAGHHAESAYIRVDVEVDGKPNSIWGHRLSPLQATSWMTAYWVNKIELLQHCGPLPRQDAEGDFRSAAERLIRDRVPFCTMFHLPDPDLTDPADMGVVLWRLEAPPPLPQVQLPSEPEVV